MRIIRRTLFGYTLGADQKAMYTKCEQARGN